MIFDEIVSTVCNTLNLSSDDAKARVSAEVNARYRRVTSGIGMATSRQTQVLKAATIGNPDLVFSGITKITAVIDKSSGKDDPLTEITYDEWHTEPARQQPPTKYAVYLMGTSTVTVKLNCIPTTTFTLYADGIVNLSTLSGSQSPAFDEDFHDILVFGAMSDEYRRLEKVQLQKDAETDFEHRVSDLKMFIAKSGYLDIYQGKASEKANWWETKG